MSPATCPVPNRRTYAWAGLAFAAFVVYGSLVPFNFRHVPLDDALSRLEEVVTGPLRVPSRADWVANVLLMLPLGFSLMGALGADRPGTEAVGDAVLLFPVCLLLSVAVEFGQVFLPGRVCSLGDVAAQGVGALLGFLLWGFCGQKGTEWARRLLHTGEGASPGVRLLPAYLALLGAVYLLPLDLTLRPSELYRKFRDGHVNLVPFAPPAEGLYSYGEKTALNVVYFALLGVLFAGLPGRRWRDPGAWGRVFLHGLGVVVLLQGAKLFVVSRSWDVTDVVVCTVSVLAGWRLALVLAQHHARSGLADWSGGRAILLALWLAAVVFVTWQPFDFDGTLAGPRLQRLPLLPFADLRAGQELLALTGVVQKLVLYLPLGVLLTSWRPVPVRLAWLPSLLVGLLVAASLEAGQLFLVTRTAGVSDVYVQAAGALLGSLLARRVVASEKEPESPTRQRRAGVRPVPGLPLAALLRPNDAGDER